MARKRQVKKNLGKYGKKVRGKSRRNIRPESKKSVTLLGAITINPCTKINVVETRPYPVPTQVFEVTSNDPVAQLNKGPWDQLCKDEE